MTNKTQHTQQITVETHSVTIIRTSGKQVTAYCERCQTNVTAFAPEQIAVFLNATLAEICRRVQSDELHLTSHDRGAALICCNRVEKTIKNNKTQE